MSFKSNLDEKQELQDYRKHEKIFYGIFFVFLSFIVLFILGKITGSSLTSLDYWYRVPFLSKSRNLDIFLIVFISLFYFWANGTKRKVLIKIFERVPYFGKMLIQGKENELQDFFYPKVKFTDGIKRGNGFHYFNGENRNISNLLDFGKYSHKDGTKKIIALFRDKEQEMLRKDSGSFRGKRAERAKRQLEAIQGKYKGNPTPNQETLFMDLFLMLEGIYHSYANDFGDKIFIDKKMKNPLKIYRHQKTNRIAKLEVDTSIDVFRDSKVYFSIDMIIGTVRDLTALYTIFLEKRLERGRFKSIGKKESIIRFEMFFKFFMLRRILLNYSNIPSGWLCVKIEDYTMRAIASNIDRPMLIDINEKNDGSTSAYNSDVEATAFLFTYWAFMNEKKVKKAIQDIDFIYEASKEVKEINARRIAQKAMEEIEREHDETYNAISDDDLVILSPKDEVA